MREEALRKEVGTWIDWARRELPKGGNIPPIFNTYQAWDPWWRNCGDPPWISWFCGCPFEEIDHGGPELLSVFEEILLETPGEVSPRFVALSTYHALAHLPTLYQEDLVSEARERHARNLAYLTRLVSPDECHDWRITRWEILNSYVISDWRRARELYNRSETLNLLPPAAIRTRRGVFTFLAALGKEVEGTLEFLLWPPDE